MPELTSRAGKSSRRGNVGSENLLSVMPAFLAASALALRASASRWSSSRVAGHQGLTISPLSARCLHPATLQCHCGSICSLWEPLFHAPSCVPLLKASGVGGPRGCCCSGPYCCRSCAAQWGPARHLSTTSFWHGEPPVAAGQATDTCQTYDICVGGASILVIRPDCGTGLSITGAEHRPKHPHHIMP